MRAFVPHIDPETFVARGEFPFTVRGTAFRAMLLYSQPEKFGDGFARIATLESRLAEIEVEPFRQIVFGSSFDKKCEYRSSEPRALRWFALASAIGLIHEQALWRRGKPSSSVFDIVRSLLIVCAERSGYTDEMEHKNNRYTKSMLPSPFLEDAIALVVPHTSPTVGLTGLDGLASLARRSLSNRGRNLESSQSEKDRIIDLWLSATKKKMRSENKMYTSWVLCESEDSGQLNKNKEADAVELRLVDLCRPDEKVVLLSQTKTEVESQCTRRMI